MRFSGVALAVGLPAALASSENQRPLGNGKNLIGSWDSAAQGKKPNIVFVLTDDQDLHMNSLDYMPLLKKHLIDEGGYPKFINQGLNNAYLPIWLQEAGYDTYYTGKLFNAHTVDNYDSPYPAGWNSSDFLLDPYTYMYLNASYQRNRQHTIDVLASKALSFLDDAAANPDRPFFLGIAPVAPHSNVESASLNDPDGDINDIETLVEFTPPIPLKRHEHLFPDARIPRTPNFNPDAPSGASWVRKLPQLGADNVAFNDHFYRQRLRALQGVDELVAGVVEKLAEHGLLEDTYIIYTTDNGYHIGQHRLQPGKECGFEEDINIPLIVRGPGVPKGEVTEVVTTHVDLAPTILGIAGAPSRADFDGEAIPLAKAELEEAVKSRHEHVTGKLFRDDEKRLTLNNTYKALRIIGGGGKYNFYYSVWCSNEHELYDLKTDPYQLNNLLHSSAKRPKTLLGVPFDKVIARLDALLFVLKSCKGQTCVRPWHALHPNGNVQNLHDALSSRFDVFYEKQQKKVSYNRCEMGYILGSEGPQFETDGLVYRQGARWSEWV
ncbi:hypothetical protein N0V88_006037 [Collariella sp. IMI 366227]|nr:hypothetical protein N0V88_006037 [Collariella sp. IMI 366227]